VGWRKSLRRRKRQMCAKERRLKGAYYIRDAVVVIRQVTLRRGPCIRQLPDVRGDPATQWLRNLVGPPIR
jgi:hypothetical protein